MDRPLGEGQLSGDCQGRHGDTLTVNIRLMNVNDGQLMIVHHVSHQNDHMEVSQVMGVPPVIIHFRLGFSLINNPFGVPPWLWKPPYSQGVP